MVQYILTMRVSSSLLHLRTNMASICPRALQRPIRRALDPRKNLLVRSQRRPALDLAGDPSPGSLPWRICTDNKEDRIHALYLFR